MKTVYGDGFTLIEVAFAVLIFSVATLAIFNLFPNGLRMVDDNTADTTCALFAETVMAGLKANESDAVALSDLVFNILPGVSVQADGSTNTCQFPQGSAGNDGWIKYALTVSSNKPYTVMLLTWYGSNTDTTKASPSRFIFEIPKGR